MNKPKILIVGDSFSLLNDVTPILREAGFEVVTSAGVSSALNILKKDSEICVIVTLSRMEPNLDGPDLFAILHEKNPALANAMIFLGTLPDHARADQVRDANLPVLEWPIRGEKLIDGCLQAIEQHLNCQGKGVMENYEKSFGRG